MRTHYEILGVPENASHERIKVAYRRLALRHHPDRNAGDTRAAARFRSATAAYEVLADPERREKYDAELRLNRLWSHLAKPSLLPSSTLPKPTTHSSSDLAVGIFGAVGLLAGIYLASRDRTRFDRSVGRYRGSDGRFR